MHYLNMKTESINIVQSYWSKSYQSNQPDFGWYDKAYHYMSWTLSCLKLSQFYRHVKLVTDSPGAEILVGKLNLPYTSVSYELDGLNNCDEKLWTLGKLRAYELQDEPFIHVDGDVFIWNKFPDELENAPLVAQNEEKEYPYNCEAMGTLLSLGFVFPEGVKVAGPITESNAGILGGRDIKFFKYYAKQTKKFLSFNAQRIKEFKGNNVAINTILEQYLFHELSAYRNIPVTYFFKKDITYKDFNQLTRFSLLPHKTQYIHAIGSFKTKMETGERIARCLWYEFPEYYDRLMNLIKNQKL